MAKITWEDKVGVKPKTVRINQVQDDDMNEIKRVVNTNDENALYQGDNTLKKTTTVQVTPEFAININDGKVTSFVVGDETLQLNGPIKIIPDGVTPVVGNALGYTNTDGSIGQFPITRGNINSVRAGEHLNNSGTPSDPILDVITSDFASTTSRNPIRSSRIANLLLNMQTAIGMLIPNKTCRIGTIADFSSIDYDTPYLVVRIPSQGNFFLVENSELPNLQGALDNTGNIVNISFYREGVAGSVYRIRGAYPNVIGGAIDRPEGVPTNYTVFEVLNGAFVALANNNTFRYTLSVNTLVSTAVTKDQKENGRFSPSFVDVNSGLTYTTSGVSANYVINNGMLIATISATITSSGVPNNGLFRINLGGLPKFTSSPVISIGRFECESPNIHSIYAEYLISGNQEPNYIQFRFMSEFENGGTNTTPLLNATFSSDVLSIQILGLL